MERQSLRLRLVDPALGRPGVFFAWSYGGQLVFVVPDLNLTVVTTSDPAPVTTRDGHVDRVHNIFDTSLIPAAERGRANRDD